MEISRSQEGQSLLEVLIALAILVIITSGVFPLLGSQVTGLIDSHDRIKAMYLTREGVQASRAIHSRSFYELTNGTHGLALLDGSWQLSESSDQVDKFTRTITISSPDLVTRKITAEVLWTNTAGISQTVNFTFSTLFTDWYQIPVWGNWGGITLLGQADIGPTATGMGVDSNGTIAVIASHASSGKATLYTFDVSNKQYPYALESISTGDDLNDVVLYGSYLITGGTKEYNEIRVYDASNMSQINLIDTYSLDGVAIRLYLQDIYLYVATAVKVYVINISNPNNVTLAGSKSVTGDITDIDGLDNLLYVASTGDTDEVQIFDISQPTSPLYISSINLPGTEDAKSLQVQDQYLLVGTDTKSSNSEVWIYDMTVPAAPQLVANIETGSSVAAIEFVLPYVFLGTTAPDEELKIYDIRDLSAPQKIQSANLSQVVRDLVLRDNYLYLSLRSQDALKIIGPAQ